MEPALRDSRARNESERDMKKKIVIEVDVRVLSLLGVIDDPVVVIMSLIDHAQQGVYRPGAWEREWLIQAFGDLWTEKLVAGDPYGRPGCQGVFEKPDPKQYVRRLPSKGKKI